MDDNVLIKKADLAAILGLSSKDHDLLFDTIGRVTGIQTLNEKWEKLRHYSNQEFLTKFLEEQEISIDVRESDRAKIPERGAFITISNHPFGALDGLLLLHLITPRRPDFKVQANFLLQRVHAVAPYILPVNPLETHKELRSSYSGIKHSLLHLNEGGGVGIFPSGEVSSFQLDSKKVTDRKWQTSSIRFIKKRGVPVIPIYFEGRNSAVFHLLGLIHPLLRTAILPSELFKKEKQSIKIRIGSPISPKELNSFDSVDQLTKFLRAKTYFLKESTPVHPFFVSPIRFPSQPKAIAHGIDRECIIKEIENLRESGKLILEKSSLQLFFTEHQRIPFMLQEIGRLREITYREIGEGTNRERDLDEFDLIYRHLILIDKTNDTIVGAYRLGLGNEIMPQFGVKGFYTRSLFKYKKEFKPILGQSIEMGRSFIIKEYQQKPLPLFTLWNGIAHIIKENQAHRYLLGPVSISNHFSPMSKELMVAFIKQYYFNEDMAKWVIPKKKFRCTLDQELEKTFMEYTQKDVKKMDQIISDIEVSGQKMPVLLKKYLKQNAKIIGFNIDPKFNNALDALMILDVDDLPETW